MAMSTRQGESRLKITGKKRQLKKKKKTKRLQNLERLALSLAFVVMRTAKSHFLFHPQVLHPPDYSKTGSVFFLYSKSSKFLLKRFKK